MSPTTADLLLPMFGDAVEMLSLAWTGFRDRNVGTLEMAGALGRAIDNHEKELTERLIAAPPVVDGLRFVPSHLERIGDAVDGMLRVLRGMLAHGTEFTEGGHREVDQLFDRATELLECARDCVLTGNRVLARHVEIESMRFHGLVSEFARAHEERLVTGVCQPDASSSYLALLDHLREVTRLARRIAARVVPADGDGLRRLG
jgi:phosphate:Na+ symporter